MKAKSIKGKLTEGIQSALLESMAEVDKTIMEKQKV